MARTPIGQIKSFPIPVVKQSIDEPVPTPLPQQLIMPPPEQVAPPVLKPVAAPIAKKIEPLPNLGTSSKVPTLKVFRRKLASIEPEQVGSLSVEKIKRRSKKKPISAKSEFRLGMYGGVSSYSVMAGTEQLSNFMNPLLGVAGDFRWKHYSIEIDGYKAMSAQRSLSDESSGVNLDKSIDSFGGFVNVNGRLPFGVSNSPWLIPRFGLGFGYVGITDKTTEGPISTSVAATVMGLYALAGVEFIPVRFFTISIDYAKSVIASAKLAIEGPISGPSSVSGDFSRLRAASLYQFTPNFLAGAQYVKRSLDYGTSSSMNQFGALFFYQF